MYRIYLLLYFIHYGKLGLAKSAWPVIANRSFAGSQAIAKLIKSVPSLKNYRVFGWFPGFQDSHGRCMVYRTHSIAFSLHQFSMENWKRVGLSRQCRKPLLRSDLPKGKHCGDKRKYFLLIYIYLFYSEPHYLLNHDGTIIRTTCKKVPLYKSIEFDMALK